MPAIYTYSKCMRLLGNESLPGAGEVRGVHGVRRVRRVRGVSGVSGLSGLSELSGLSGRSGLSGVVKGAGLPVSLNKRCRYVEQLMMIMLRDRPEAGTID
jgi:hypothetical protein